MPRESDVSDDAGSKDKSRVTRSLRKRLNSTDQEDSPVSSSQLITKQSSASRKQLNSISEKDSDLDLDNSSSTIAPNDKTGTIDEPSIRKTRARASSALTEENVTAMNNTPLRRTTRRNSGAQEQSVLSAAALPLTGTPSRRSTRRTSVTSDDNTSVASSSLAVSTRKTTGRKSIVIAPPATVHEESEVEEISATPRKTPNKSMSKIQLKSPADSDQDEKDVKKTTAESVVPEPHPVAIHKSPETALYATPTKRLSVRLNRSAMLPQFQSQSQSIIEIIDESCIMTSNQTIYQIDDSPENSQSESSARKDADIETDTTNTNNDDIVIVEVPIKEEVRMETSSESNQILSNDASMISEKNNASTSEPNVSQGSTKLNINNSKMEEVIIEPVAESNVPDEIPSNGILSEKINASTAEQNVSQGSSKLNDSNPITQDAPIVAAAVEETTTEHSSPNDASNTSSVFLETTDASTAETNNSQRTCKLNKVNDKNEALTMATDTNNTNPLVENDAPLQSPSKDASIESKDMIDASRNSVAGSKSVTFADVIADTSGKSDDVFHDTCTDFVDNDETEDVPDPTHKIHAGATPSRTRFNLSLRSSTPLVPSAMALNAAAEASPTVKRGRPPLQRASIHTDVQNTVKLPHPTEPLSRSWSQAVHGTSSNQIDKLAQDVSTEEVIKRPVKKAQLDDFIDDDEEDEDNSREENEQVARNGFVDDEAEEVNEDYEEDDSMDSSTREYLRANEVPDDGHSIGSKDSEQEGDFDHEVADEEEDEEEMDSFIVSDDEEEEDNLLEGTGDDLSDVEEKKVVKPRRSIRRLADSSDEDDAVVEAIKNPDEDFNDDTTLVSNEVGVKETEQPETSISVSERQINKLLSKSISDASDKKANSKLNKSLGAKTHTADIDFSASAAKAIPKNDSEASEASNSSIEVPERQIKKLLSNSLHLGKQKQKKSKHNNSLGTALDKVDVDVSFSAFVSENKLKKSKIVYEVAESTGEEPVADIEMLSPPKTKVPKVKPQKEKVPLSYDAILNRCQTLLEQAHEARRSDKIQNKKDIPDEVVERLKSKREQKQLEKARRAANLLKIQQDEAERVKRKAEKKLLKKSKIAAIAERSEEISKAIGHGIDLLSGKTSTTGSLPKKVADVTAHIPKVEKSKKNKRNAQDFEEVQPAVVPTETKKQKKNKLQAPVIATTIESFNEKHHQATKKSKKTASCIELLANVQLESTVKNQKKTNPTLDTLNELLSIKSKKSKKTDQISNEPEARKPSTKKVKRLLESDESIIQSIPKKLKVSKVDRKRLNILSHNSSSEYEPETIPKLTKKPSEYNVLQVRSVAAQDKAMSRKRKPVAPPSPVKPQWTSAGEFLVSKIPFAQSENVQHVHHKSYGTDFIVTSLGKKRKIKATASETTAAPPPVHAQVAEYRAKMTNSERVKRETTAQMLQHKKKMHAYTRF